MLAGGAMAQGYGQRPGSMNGPGGAGHGPDESMPSAPATVKPDKAARKASEAGQKTMAKAREFEQQAAQATDPDKKARALEKAEDSYGRALDQFTEVLRNRDDADAWNQVGYIHLHFGAYRESIDDYNHALALKPDMEEAVAHRAQAYLAQDRLDEAKAAYMELFNHARPFADELLSLMQTWVKNHRATANGVRPGEIDSFDKWVTERSGIAQTAANP